MNLWTRVTHLMMVIGLLLGLVAAQGATVQAVSAISVTASATTIAQFDLLELTFALPRSYSNPYDADQIDARAIITTPSGATERAAAFWFETVNYVNSGNDDFKVVPGSGVWKVRYAPRQSGNYQYRVEATDAIGTETSATATFTAIASSARGYVRIDPLHPTRLAYENGEAFLARGANLNWNQQLFEYSDHFAGFKQAKMNFARIWLPFPSGNFTLEWTGTQQISNVDTISFPGLGKYSQDDAHKLDWLFQQARANDITLMLCVMTHHNFINWSSDNPYNSLLGGKALNFWTNAEAKRNFRNYIRYIGARYGAYTSLGILEYWNELDDAVTRPSTSVMRAWHQEMVDTLHAASPRRPLTTTSFKAEGKSWNDPTGLDSFGSLPMLDVAQAHHYDSSANATNMVWGWGYEARWANGKFNRPYFTGEYGYKGEELYPGANGSNLKQLNHHSTWAPIMHGGAAGGAMLWRVNWYFYPPQDFRDNSRRFGDWIEGELPYLRQMNHFWAGENLNGFWLGGYRKANRAALYVLSKAARWDVDSNAIGDVVGATYALTGFTNGAYRVEYIDPMTLASLGTSTVTVTNGSVTLALPAFRRDLAIKVFDPNETPPPSPSVPPGTPSSPAPTSTAPRTSTTLPPTSTPSSPTATVPAGTAPPATATSMPTIAVGAPLSATVSAQSANTNSGNPATNLLDGVNWTRWETTWSTPERACFVLDVGQALQIGRAKWQLGSKDYAKAFAIQSRSTIPAGGDPCADNPAWTTHASLSGGTVSNAWQEQRLDVTAQYVRFLFTNPPAPAGKLGGLSTVDLYEN